MDQIFDKLPYGFLENVKSAYVTLTGVVVGLLLALIYFFTLYSAVAEEYAGLVSNRENVKRKLDQYQRTVQQKEMVSRQLIFMEGKLSLAKKQYRETKNCRTCSKSFLHLVRGVATFP